MRKTTREKMEACKEDKGVLTLTRNQIKGTYGLTGMMIRMLGEPDMIVDDRPCVTGLRVQRIRRERPMWVYSVERVKKFADEHKAEIEKARSKREARRDADEDYD